MNTTMIKGANSLNFPWNYVFPILEPDFVAKRTIDAIQ